MLRQNPSVLELPFKDSIRRPDRDNTIDVYISDDYEDILADGIWEQFFTEKPAPLTREEKKVWLHKAARSFLLEVMLFSRLVIILNALTAAV